MSDEQIVATPTSEEEQKLYGHRLFLIRQRSIAQPFLEDEFLKDLEFLPVKTPFTDPKGNPVMGAASPVQIMRETDDLLEENTKALRALKGSGIIIAQG